MSVDAMRSLVFGSEGGATSTGPDVTSGERSQVRYGSYEHVQVLQDLRRTDTDQRTDYDAGRRTDMPVRHDLTVDDSNHGDNDGIAPTSSDISREWRTPAAQPDDDEVVQPDDDAATPELQRAPLG